ncbi:hypothetical protein OPV22_003632 [Ensete ventricosum]|uniref:Bifunctional inhibitor/plant lipid transfer protein/seed storage helical domain-containing protein n=1 Tax=Ensete ventricosum TaxID=4639 RepID=A0AAV8S131_ENSVE|nr:hypothetical protein OPV22_003632 [Ensete ventricosum]
MAFWLSIASADMAAYAHSSTNCTFAERTIKVCRPYLQKGNRNLRPGRTCCFVALSIYLVGPECFCDVVKPSSLGVPVNASHISLLPKLCHLPEGALHCNGVSGAISIPCATTFSSSDRTSATNSPANSGFIATRESAFVFDLNATIQSSSDSNSGAAVSFSCSAAVESAVRLSCSAAVESAVRLSCSAAVESAVRLSCSAAVESAVRFNCSAAF